MPRVYIESIEYTEVQVWGKTVGISYSYHTNGDSDFESTQPVQVDGRDIEAIDEVLQALYDWNTAQHAE